MGKRYVYARLMTDVKDFNGKKYKELVTISYNDAIGITEHNVKFTNYVDFLDGRKIRKVHQHLEIVKTERLEDFLLAIIFYYKSQGFKHYRKVGI